MFRQPFSHSHETDTAGTVKADEMSESERNYFPHLTREPKIFLSLRNLIISLWNLSIKVMFFHNYLTFLLRFPLIQNPKFRVEANHWEVSSAYTLHKDNIDLGRVKSNGVKYLETLWSEVGSKCIGTNAVKRKLQHNNLVFNFLQSCPLLKPHTLSNIVSIDESISGTSFLWGG